MAGISHLITSWLRGQSRRALVLDVGSARGWRHVGAARVRSRCLRQRTGPATPMGPLVGRLRQAAFLGHHALALAQSAAGVHRVSTRPWHPPLCALSLLVIVTPSSSLSLGRSGARRRRRAHGCVRAYALTLRSTHALGPRMRSGVRSSVGSGLGSRASVALAPWVMASVSDSRNRAVVVPERERARWGDVPETRTMSSARHGRRGEDEAMGLTAASLSAPTYHDRTYGRDDTGREWVQGRSDAKKVSSGGERRPHRGESHSVRGKLGVQATRPPEGLWPCPSRPRPRSIERAGPVPEASNEPAPSPKHRTSRPRPRSIERAGPSHQHLRAAPARQARRIT